MKWLKRLFCNHVTWARALPWDDGVVPMLGWTDWKCADCGKVMSIYFTDRDYEVGPVSMKGKT